MQISVYQMAEILLGLKRVQSWKQEAQQILL